MELKENSSELNQDLSIGRIERFLGYCDVEGVLKEMQTKYEGYLKFLSYINQKHIIRSTYLKNALEIEGWCEINYGDKKIWERSLPSSTAKDEYEKRLGSKLSNIRRRIMNKYAGKKLEEIENEEDRQTVEIIRGLDEEYGLGDYLKNALEIEDWCQRNYGDKKIWEKNLPNRYSTDEYEKKLGIKLIPIRQNIMKKYEGKALEKIEDEEDRQIVEIIRSLDEEYGLGTSLKNALEIEGWCKSNYGDKKVLERRLPSSIAKDECEKKLGIKLATIRQNIMKKYEGKKLEEIEDEEDRQVVKIIRGLDEEYGLKDYPKNARKNAIKNALEIEEWCKSNYGDKKIWDRSLPRQVAKDGYEKKLGKKLNAIRFHIMKKYEGKALEKIEDEEDRQVVEIIRGLDEEYGLGDYLKNALEIEGWCKRNYGDKKIWDRSLPRQGAKNECEKKLGTKLSTIRYNIMKKYEGKKLEEIEDEEDRQVVEIIRGLDEEYGLKDYPKNARKNARKNAIENAIEIEKWCEINYGDKKIWERILPRANSKNECEKKLGTKLATIRQRIMKKYEGKRLEEIEDEEDRQIVEKIRRLDKEYGLGTPLKNALEIEEWCEINYGDKKIWERSLPSITAKDECEKKLGIKLNNIRQNIMNKYEGKTLEEIEDEEDRKTVEIIRGLDKEYGLGITLKNALEIEDWCKSNYGDKKKWERRLPSSIAKDEYEKKLGIKLIPIRQNIMKKYEGKAVEDEEDRKTVEIIRRLDEEYGRKKKITGQDIGMSSFDASAEECDKAQQGLTILIETTKEGEITQND